MLDALDAAETFRQQERNCWLQEGAQAWTDECRAWREAEAKRRQNELAKAACAVSPVHELCIQNSPAYINQRAFCNEEQNAQTSSCKHFRKNMATWEKARLNQLACDDDPDGDLCLNTKTDLTLKEILNRIVKELDHLKARHELIRQTPTIAERAVCRSKNSARTRSEKRCVWRKSLSVVENCRS